VQSAAAPPPPGSAVVDWLLIGFGLAILGVTQNRNIWGDASYRLDALTALLEDHRLVDYPYSLIGPLFSAPLWFIGRVRYDIPGWTSAYNYLLFTIAIGSLYALLRRRVDAALLRRFLLLLVAASMIAAHTQTFYGEVFTMVTVGVGLVATTVPAPGWRGAMLHAGGWSAVALGVANTPASLVAVALVTGSQALTRRRLRYAMPALAAVLLVIGEAWLRRGSPFVSGYEHDVVARTVMPYSGAPGWSYPFFFGLMGILFSFGRGLVFFIPGLVLPARRRLRAQRFGVELAKVHGMWMLFVVGLILVYASWWAWYGGLFFGPRFFLIAILPASLALAVWLSDNEASPVANLATLGVLALSVWVGADALLFGQDFPDTCYANSYQLEFLCYFTPEFSALWAPFVTTSHLDDQQVFLAAYYLLVFGWLAAPVGRRLARQAVHWLAEVVRRRPASGKWRF
jgi:hypothetical protein